MDISKRLCLNEVVFHHADVGLIPAWTMWDSLWHRDSCFSPKFFSSIIYQCSILELLIYNLSIWQHHSIEPNQKLQPVRFSGYFFGACATLWTKTQSYKVMLPLCSSSYRWCVPEFVEFVCLCVQLRNIFTDGQSYSLLTCNVTQFGVWISVLSSSLSTMNINFNYHPCG